MKFGLATLAISTALLGAPSASGKDFGPGDLRICNASRCIPVMRPAAVALLGPFYYSGPQLTRALPPAVGTPYYELRFPNGYVTGIVATRRLDRFLSYGVHLERFARGIWYRVPPKLAAEFRALTLGLRPLRLTRAAVAKSR
jgi:hypothetical protein